MLSIRDLALTFLSKKTRPLTIGITGNAGSGKTTVCNHLMSLGLPVILLDNLAREVVAPGSIALKRISDHFGNGILSEDGSLNRPALRQIILMEDGKRRELERMLHPEIISLMHLRITQAGMAGAGLVAVEVPLLFELGMTELFDMVLLVTAEKHLQIKRLSERDQVSALNAGALIETQIPDQEKRQQSDFIIDNNGSYEDLINSVDRFHQIVYQKIMENGKSA